MYAKRFKTFFLCGQRRTDFEPPFRLKEVAMEQTSLDQEKTNESGRLESACS
jgi:hypothetical protein